MTEAEFEGYLAALTARPTGSRNRGANTEETTRRVVSLRRRKPGSTR